MSRLTVADYRAQHSDAEPLPDHLPYLACVDDVVLLQDRDGDGPSLGAIWELDPVSVEGAPEDRWKQLTQAAHVGLAQEIAAGQLDDLVDYPPDRQRIRHVRVVDL